MMDKTDDLRDFARAVDRLGEFKIYVINRQFHMKVSLITGLEAETSEFGRYKALFGGSIGHSDRTGLWYYNLQEGRAIKALEQIRGFLERKGDQADVLLALGESRAQTRKSLRPFGRLPDDVLLYREGLADKLRALKRRDKERL